MRPCFRVGCVALSIAIGINAAVEILSAGSSSDPIELESAPIVVAKQYFGDELPNSDILDHRKFETGQRNFVRDFGNVPDRGPFSRDRSCLGCHSVPMPGGSGGTRQSIVMLRSVPMGHAQFDPPLANERADKYPTLPEFTRRAQPLFGLGLIDWVDMDYLRRMDEDGGVLQSIADTANSWRGERLALESTQIL